MKATIEAPKVQKLVHVGDCLYRSSITDIYYAIFKRSGKQVKRSLKTADRELAKRRTEELRRKVERLSADLVEFLGYSGCRLGEVVGDKAHGNPPLVWGDVNFELKTFTVAGKGNCGLARPC